MKVIHVFKDEKFAPGLGDFLRGSIAIAQTKHADLELDFTGSGLDAYLETSMRSEGVAAHFFNQQTKELQKYIEAGADAKVIAVKTNVFPLRDITKTDILKVREKLRLKPTFAKKLEHVLQSLPKNYKVVHIRVGDHSGHGFLRRVEGPVNELGPENASKIFKELDAKVLEGCRRDEVIVISDRLELKELFRAKGYLVSDSLPVHTSNLELKSEELEGTLVDFFILAHATKIFQYSNYLWGSGFSDSAACLYHVPIVRMGPKAFLRPYLISRVEGFMRRKNLVRPGWFFSRRIIVDDLSLVNQWKHQITNLHRETSLFKSGLGFLNLFRDLGFLFLFRVGIDLNCLYQVSLEFIFGPSVNRTWRCQYLECVSKKSP